tara:strand:- start:664 stop:1284 length:621 start_codon:yes stop_codon:yes gene_type:complete
MPIQLLPALGMGAKVLLGGATIGGTALGAASVYDGVTGAGKGFRNQAYAAGPDPETGKFSAGLIGNQFINEDSPEFAEGFKNYALNKNDRLIQMSSVLGDKLIFDSSKSIPQNIAANEKAFAIASQQLTNEISELDPKVIKEERRYQDQLRATQEARLDNLNFQRMQIAREDQRYNERLDRDELYRRQEAVMAMMGGLTSLGAAFA